MTEVKKPQHVLFVIRYFHPFIGGLEKKVFNLARTLSGAGLKITIVTSRFSLSWPKKEPLHGIEIIRLPSPRIKIAGAFLYNCALFCYLWRKRRNFDLCHTFQVGYSSACAIAAGRLLGIQTVLTLSSSGSGGDVLRHRRSLWGRIFLRICSKATCIVALHEKMVDEIKAFYPASNISIIQNCVDVGQYQPSPDRAALRLQSGFTPDDRLIVYAGRLSAEKGVDFLLRAFSAMPRGKTIRLWIYGEGPQRASLLRQAHDLGLDDSVRFQGAIENVAAVLQIADVFIMPSHFEGMSNAVLEAMACGVPVIATDVPGNREIIEHNRTGLLVPSGDTAALAGAMTSLLDNPALAGLLSENARKQVAGQYSSEDAVVLHRQVYDALACPEPGGERPA